MVVTQRALFTCALYLTAALSVMAGFFVLLGADFLAAVQVLLYVGGVVVILVFAVMLSSVDQAKISAQVNEQWIPSLMVCLGILFVILAGLNRSGLAMKGSDLSPTTGSIGRLLFGEQVLPFEAVSLVLMASLVGAVLFSGKKNS